jgi:LuxR family maltose regulon positive regulatory protein
MARSSAADIAASGRPIPPDAGPQRVVLAAKLAPPELAHATVARPRLLAQLSRAVQVAPLTLLSGPAGSGKTVLAASWREAEARSRSIAWLTLDGYDDEPAAFWSYFVEALRGAGVSVTDVPRLVPGEPLPSGFVPALAGTIATRRTPVVLIVDNADDLAERSIIAGLDLLVRHAGSRLRLVLCARADPQLPLHQYRLAGTMSEIRGAQLAFTPAETRELLAAMGVPVSAEVAERLCAETQGWAVGLRLAGAPLKQGVPPERLVTSLAHDDGSVAQYLFAEVLAGQPAGVRRLLLRISVTAELHPDLVDRLSGRPHSRRVLAALAHANAFVEESGGVPGGFRIHPLFREMLRAQLAFDHPTEVAGLHRACAVWYASAGRPTDAVEHALAAGDWPFAARLLVDDLVVARLLAHGSVPAGSTLRQLPPELRGPDAAVLRSASALGVGARPAGTDVATAAAVTPADRPALRASAALVCLAAAVAAGAPAERVRALDAVAQDASAELPEDDRQGRREHVAVLAAARAFAAFAGDVPVDDLVAQLRAAAAAAQAAGARRLRCRTVGLLGLLEASAGQLTRGAQHATEAESVGADLGTDEHDRPAASAAALASVHLQRYALVEAREWLGRGLARERDRAAGPEAAATAAVLAVLHGQLLRLRREYDQAGACLDPHLPGEGLPRWVRQRLLLEAARLAFARGRPAEGLQLLDDPAVGPDEGARMRATAALLGTGGAAVPLVAEAHGGPAGVVDSLLVRACQLAESGAAPAAADELARALAVARPELLRLPFVDAPPQARRLLRTHPRLQAPGRWLSPSSPATPATGHPVPVEPSAADSAALTQDLSERETEVLQHLAEMLSTAEIAATMFISVNTVRTHIRSILRKLGVSRRNQAVRRARERGLL